MKTQTKYALLVGGTLLAAWTVYGASTKRSAESVPYDLVRHVDGVELRQYPELVLVETSAPDQMTAFGRLFRYISGANEKRESIEMTTPVSTSGESIAMTAPVRSRLGGGDSRMRMGFYLPEAFDNESAPVPTDPSVRLVVEPPRTLAVKSFSWLTPSWRVDRMERRLLSTLERHGIEVTDEPFLLRYDPPFTPPFLRRNEVAVQIERVDR